MSATCQQHVKMSPIFDQNACRGQHILVLTQDFCVGDCQQNGNYKKSTYKLNYVGKLEKHTPQTPKITKNDPPTPYPPTALPPISMGRAAVPPTNGAADPYGPAQGARGWVWQRNGWFACLGRQKETHQKTERWVGIGLRWPPINNNNQQSTNSRQKW
jgi:hypothetical protein